MRRVLIWLAGLASVLAVAGIGFWFAYLRDIPEIEVQFQALRMGDTEQHGEHDCFWMGPVSIETFNVAFPDSGARYWTTVFEASLGEGDYIELKGFYPRARYFSINTYTDGAVPYDNLTDQTIAPDENNTNPFLTGRYSAGQAYTIRLVPGAAQDARPENTLYFGPAEEVDDVPLIFRVYVPEGADDPTGRVGLPTATLVRANGERLIGESMCAALGSAEVGTDARSVRLPVIPMAMYQAMFTYREVRESLLESPSGTWNIFWDPRLTLLRTAAPALAQLVTFAARTGLVAKTSGYYANIDNDYVSTYINERFGEIVVLEGRLPRTPARGADAAFGGEYDLRYWSLCTNEGLATTRYADCVYDSQVMIDHERNYTIVVSKAANRPDNATLECGVTWLDWGEHGDGAGHGELGILIIRNMLPNPDFASAIQRVPRPGDEQSTMGPYLPEVQYASRADFERRGC